ncbi:MAG: magnesium transporter [Acidimicrobiia bacterium]|nr:magnesium transporter [Acidimicrobiia bacterium]
MTGREHEDDRRRRLGSLFAAMSIPLQPMRRIGRHWQAESRTISLGLVVHGVSALTGLLAGYALAASTGTLESLPGFVLIVLASNGLRGMIFGAFGARLGTALGVGAWEATLRTGSVLRVNVVAVTILTIVTAPIIAVLAWLGSLLMGGTAGGLVDFIVIAVLGGVLSGVVVGVATAFLSAGCARWEWDLDTVAAPLVTMTGDVVGVPSLVLAAQLAGRGPVTAALATASVLLAVAVLARTVLRVHPDARRIVRTSLPVLLVVMLVDLGAGGVLQAERDEFFTQAVFLVLVPAFLEAIGGFGGMYASRLGTKLHLGTVEARPVPNPLAVLDSTLVVLLAVVVLPLVAVGASFIAATAGMASPGTGTVVAVTFAGGLVATALALATGYYAAYAAVQWGLDPDDHVLPIVTAAMDLVGVLCLAAAIPLLT